MLHSGQSVDIVSHNSSPTLSQKTAPNKGGGPDKRVHTWGYHLSLSSCSHPRDDKPSFVIPIKGKYIKAVF